MEENKSDEYLEDEYDGEQYEDDEVCGYCCLCCGNIQDDDFECEVCTSNALDPIYF